jgi:hypothetical protein
VVEEWERDAVLGGYIDGKKIFYCVEVSRGTRKSIRRCISKQKVSQVGEYLVKVKLTCMRFK